jgi:hypothetical protein
MAAAAARSSLDVADAASQSPLAAEDDTVAGDQDGEVEQQPMDEMTTFAATEEATMPPPQPPAPVLSSADAEWLRFFAGRHDLKLSLITKVMRLVHDVGAPRWTTPKELNEFIDAQPGTAFEEARVALISPDGVRLPVLRRNILNVVVDAVTQHNGHFILPLVGAKDGLRRDFVDGDHYRALCARLRRDVPRGNVFLAPIILNSGSWNLLARHGGSQV